MNNDNLENKEYFVIDDKRYFMVDIPAVRAEELFFEILPVMQSLDITKLPFSFAMKLMPYCGICNDSTNAEIRFNSPDVISMYVTKPIVLMELQARVFKKNFSFFTDGSLTRVTSVLLSGFQGNPEAGTTLTETSGAGAPQ